MRVLSAWPVQRVRDRDTIGKSDRSGGGGRSSSDVIPRGGRRNADAPDGGEDSVVLVRNVLQAKRYIVTRSCP